MTKKQTENDINKRFLDLWRELEAALKEEGPITVQDLERNLDARSRQDDVSKLRMCRQVRNYLTHDGPGLVAATEAMCGFVSAMAYEVRRARGTVKDHMLSAARYGTAGLDDTVKDAASRMVSKGRPDVLVLDSDKKLAGVLTARGLAAALSESAGAKKIKYLADRYCLDGVGTVMSDTPPKSAPETKCAVLDKNGRCVGVWNPDRGWS